MIVASAAAASAASAATALAANQTLGLSFLFVNDTTENPGTVGLSAFSTMPPPTIEFPGYIRITSMVFCIVIMGIGVIGNVMVPLVILKSKDLRNSTNIFLINLSFADLMVLLVCTPTVLVEVNTRPETWVLGEEMCKAVPFVELTVAHASVLTILAISFERYYAICKPLMAGYVCTKNRAMFICLLAWALAALFSSPMLLLTEFRMELYWDGTYEPICITPSDTLWKTTFHVGSMSLFFGVPLVLLIALYSVIARHLIVYPGAVASSHQHHAQAHPTPTPIKYRRQVVLMLGTVVVAFFVCLLPFRALNLWIIFSPPEVIGELSVDVYYNLVFFCRIMLYINSAINPILYNLMSSKFRDGFMRLCGIRRCKKTLRRRGTFTTTTTTSTTCSSTHGPHRGCSDSSWRWSGQSSSAGDSLRIKLQRRMSPAPIITPVSVTSPKHARWKSLTPSSKICGTSDGNLDGGEGGGGGKGAPVRDSCHISESVV